jgi:hypothetical protein
MRLYYDSPIEVTGQWYFCPPGAVPLPFPTAFVSSNWDDFRPAGTPVGEARKVYVSQPGRRVNAFWTPGKSPILYGEPCGSPQSFADGDSVNGPFLPVGADGVPLCCSAPQPPGGVRVGGSGRFFKPGSGGCLVGGSSPAVTVAGAAVCECETVTANY